MAGRGFLKSRLAQINAQNSEEQPKPETPQILEKHPNLEERPNLEESSKSSESCVPTVSAPIANIPALIGGQPQFRGRRVIIFYFFFC